MRTLSKRANWLGGFYNRRAAGEGCREWEHNDETIPDAADSCNVDSDLFGPVER